MIQLHLIGIGTGNPDHLTLQAIKALNAADLVLIPRKGDSKADLADLRRSLCAAVITNPAVQIAEFDLPIRDSANPDYLDGVNLWHDAIVTVWAQTIAQHPGAVHVALLVWGDPSLYDSTLRIAARLTTPIQVHVVPGITSVQALTAAHAIPLNNLGAPVTITTGRQLRDGWPTGADTLQGFSSGGPPMPVCRNRSSCPVPWPISVPGSSKPAPPHVRRMAGSWISTCCGVINILHNIDYRIT
jgi:precorrin-6A synthase